MSLSLAEIARVGVGLGKVRLWLSGHSPDIHDEDLACFDAAVQIVRDIHDQIVRCAALGASCNFKIVSRDSYPPEYARLAELSGVVFDPAEDGAVYRLVGRIVAKLEHDKLRKG